MSSCVELRREAPDSAASRALFHAYIALVQERLGAGFMPTERVFANPETFAGAGAAWLVLYEQGRPVGCGGLRPLEPGVGEIKRMFIATEARRRGHGRRLLRELEQIAAARGLCRVRLLTTEVLSEARALYAAEGYRVVSRTANDPQPVEIWLEKELVSPGRAPSDELRP